jgi:hypothetical protein
LIGFAATSFIITITLSAADATAHIVENPFAPAFIGEQKVLITLVLVATLGAIFLRGFGEAVGIAVVLVGIYLLLNFIVVADGLYQVILHPPLVIDWRNTLFTSYGSPLAMIAAALLVFPKLALGLSGFETGVVVMPLVRGDSTDTQEKPHGRIRNTRKLLTAAALIMSVLLISSSFVTTVLIPHYEFEEGGKASGRALAYLAHTYLGDIFGTAYDVSTILILWFAGSSAMAGLLNIVPRYLPRYGMAPEWTRATRPLVLIFTAICFLVTILFRADVEAQGGAYATGVLTLMTSAAIAVTLAAWRLRQTLAAFGFGLVTLIFIYTVGVNIFERPEGLQIAGLFILAIIIISLLSRIWRATELRTERVVIDETAQQFIAAAAKRGAIRIIANQLDSGDTAEYRAKERETRADTHLPPGSAVLFLEVTVCDASEFEDVVEVKGVEVGKYHVLRAESSSVPNAIAALLLHIRDSTGNIPHVYFEWTEGNPVIALLWFLLFGQGDIAPVTREVLRKAERDPERRPVVHVGG